MRDLKKNKQPVYFSVYMGMAEIIDADGRFTGETYPAYSDPELVMLNHSPASGETVLLAFGDFKDYSRLICTTRKFPFDEQSRLWVDKIPDDTLAEPTDHNYIVRKVAKSLNSWLYAIQEVLPNG